MSESAFRSWLAFLCNLRFTASDLGDPEAALKLHLDATKFAMSTASASVYAREDILRATLECLRRCLPNKLRSTPLTFCRHR